MMRILWNPKNPHHFNRLKKNDAWEEIARDTERSIEHCKKKKVEYLVSALKREKMKMKKRMGKGMYLKNFFVKNNFRREIGFPVK